MRNANSLARSFAPTLALPRWVHSPLTALLLAAAVLICSPALADPGPGDPDPLFAYPLPSTLEPDSTNLVPVEDGWLVVRSVLPPPGVNESKIELTRIDIDGRVVPTYGQAGRLDVTVPAPVNLSGAAIRLENGAIVLGGYRRTESADGSVAAIAMIGEDGRLVSSFGTGGLMTLDALGSDDRVADIRWVADDRIATDGQGIGIAVWSSLSKPSTGCATDRASFWATTVGGQTAVERFAQTRNSFLGSCRSVVTLGGFVDDDDNQHALMGTPLGIYDADAGSLIVSGENYGPFAQYGWYGPLAYMLLRSGSIRIAGVSAMFDWLVDPSAGVDGPTSWESMAVSGGVYAGFSTDGGRVGIVRFTDDGDLDESWGNKGVVVVQGAGRDGVRAAGGLANDVRFLGSDETGELVVATGDGVVRRYVANRFVPGGYIGMQTPSDFVARLVRTVSVEVNRVGHAEGTVTVRYEVGGDCTPDCAGFEVATAGQDFIATSGTLQWAAGDRSAKTFDVYILAPPTAQPREVIPLRLSLLTGGAQITADKGLIALEPKGGADSSGGGSGGGSSSGGAGGGGSASGGGGGGGGAGDAWLLALLGCLAWVVKSQRSAGVLARCPSSG